MISEEDLWQSVQLYSYALEKDEHDELSDEALKNICHFVTDEGKIVKSAEEISYDISILVLAHRILRKKKCTKFINSNELVV